MLVPSGQQVADSLEELEAFASVLSGNLGVWATDKGGGVSVDSFDGRLRDRKLPRATHPQREAPERSSTPVDMTLAMGSRLEVRAPSTKSLKAVS